jgi:Methyltransferase domain
VQADTRHIDDSQRRIDRLPSRLRWAWGATRLLLRDPGDGLDRAFVRIRRRRTGGRPAWHDYPAEANGHRRLHQLMGWDWPCQFTGEFESLWHEVVASMRAQGLSVGRGSYGGWDDADAGLARLLWCLVRNLRPPKVVETGVARGLTSRVILEALELTGDGHLWSIDLPATDGNLRAEVGTAVPGNLYPRWTFLGGTSRRLLPGLLAQIQPVELFVHDSSHTNRNVRFELERAWASIEHGAVVADDIQQTPAFHTFSRRRPAAACFAAEADDRRALIGVALKGLRLEEPLVAQR